MEVKSPRTDEVEQVVGKNVIENIKTIEKATAEVLKNNLDLRRVENRKLVRAIVEQKLGREVADESVPRACRQIQNTEGLWCPEEPDNREELEKINQDYYSQNKGGKNEKEKS